MAMETMNGMRQPQALNAASGMSAWVHRITTMDSASPIDEVIWIQPVRRPRRSGRECSAT